MGHHWDWPFTPLPIQLKSILENSFYTWNQFSLGYPRYSFSAFYHIFAYGPVVLGLSGSAISKFWPYITIVLSGCFMFYLVRDILTKEFMIENKFILYFSSLSSAYFYSLSPFLFNDFIGGSTPQYFSYSLFPLAIYLFRRFSKPKLEFKYIFSLSILLTLIFFSLQNFILITLIFISYWIIQKRKIAIIKNISKSYLIFFFLNIHWFLQLFQQFFITTISSIPTKLYYYTLEFNVPSITQIFVGTGYFAPYFSMSINPYIKNIWLLVSFLAVIIVFFTLFILQKKQNKESLFWSAFLLLSFIIGTGAKEPFGEFVLEAFKKIPFMIIFRSAQHFLVLPTIALSILIGLSLSYLLGRIEKKQKYFLTIIYFLLITIWISPFFTGNLGWDNISQYGTAGVDNFKLSPGYEDILLYLSNQEKDFKILHLPMALSVTFFKAEHQLPNHGSDPTVYFSTSPAVISDFTTHPDSKKYTLMLEDSFASKNVLANSSKYLGLANVKYIILRKDVRPHFGKFQHTWNFSQVHKNLEDIEGIELVMEYKYASLWKNNYFLPVIYKSNKIDTKYNTSELPPDIFKINNITHKIRISSDDWQLRGASSNLDIKKHNETPIISFDKVPSEKAYTRIIKKVYLDLTDYKTINFDIYIQNKTLLYDEYHMNFWFGTTYPWSDGWLKKINLTDGWNHVTIDMDEMKKYGNPNINQITNIIIELAFNDADVSMENILVKNLVIDYDIENIGPVLDFKKENPTSYKIFVKDAKEPFYVIFSESFYPEWKIYEGDVGWFEIIFREPLLESNHIKINTFSNAWYMDKEGDYTLSLYFYPQSTYYIGLIISLVTFLICLLYFLEQRFKIVSKIIKNRKT